MFIRKPVQLVQQRSHHLAAILCVKSVAVRKKPDVMRPRYARRDRDFKELSVGSITEMYESSPHSTGTARSAEREIQFAAQLVRGLRRSAVLDLTPCWLRLPRSMGGHMVAKHSENSMPYSGKNY